MPTYRFKVEADDRQANDALGRVKQGFASIESQAASMAKSAGDVTMSIGKIAVKTTEVVGALAIMHKAWLMTFGSMEAATVSQVGVMSKLMDSVRLARIALTPTLFTASTIGAGIAVEMALQSATTTARENDRRALLAAGAGISIESVKALQNGADRAGLGQAGLLGAYSSLVGNSANSDAQQALRDLNVSLRDVNGSALTARELMAQLAESFGGVMDPTKKAQMAFALFGETAGTVLPELNQRMAENIRETIQWGDGTKRALAETAADLGSVGMAWDSMGDSIHRVNRAVKEYPAAAVSNAYSWLKNYRPMSGGLPYGKYEAKPPGTLGEGWSRLGEYWEAFSTVPAIPGTNFLVDTPNSEFYANSMKGFGDVLAQRMRGVQGSRMTAAFNAPGAQFGSVAPGSMLDLQLRIATLQRLRSGIIGAPDGINSVYFDSVSSQLKAATKSADAAERTPEIEKATARELASARLDELSTYAKIQGQAEIRIQQLREEGTLTASIAANVRKRAGVEIAVDLQRRSMARHTAGNASAVDKMATGASEFYAGTELEGELGARYSQATADMGSATYQQGQDFRSYQLGASRDSSLRSLDLISARTLAQKKDVADRKLAIDVDYLQKSQALEEQSIRDRYDKEESEATGALISKEAKDARLAAIDSQREQALRQMREKTGDAISKAQQDTAITEAKQYQEAYQKSFDSIKEGAGRLFDTLTGHAKNFWAALGSMVKAAALTPLRESFSNSMAGVFAPMFNGGGGAPGGRAAAGGGFASALPAFGGMAGGGGGGGLLGGGITGSPYDWGEPRRRHERRRRLPPVRRFPGGCNVRRRRRALAIGVRVRADPAAAGSWAALARPRNDRQR
jgi:hypothetical protein